MYLILLARPISLWVYRNLFWQLSKDGNQHSSGTSNATTASPKPSFRAPWRVGDAVVGGGNAGYTTSKSRHPSPCQSCSQGPPAENTGRGSLLDRPPCPHDDPIGHGTELNWTCKLSSSCVCHCVCVQIGLFQPRGAVCAINFAQLRTNVEGWFHLPAAIRLGEGTGVCIHEYRILFAAGCWTGCL